MSSINKEETLPLRARKGENSVSAFECDAPAWAEIKKRYKADELRMPCCESLAIPKTSKLGNYFFSHSRRGFCASAPESAEHIFLKTLIARAASQADWLVTTEWQEMTPEGAKWVADVFCVKGTTRVAFEVQFSYQTVDDLQSRQEAYRSSGVRAAWFASSQKFKSNYLEPSKEIPFFRVLPFEMGSEPLIQGFDKGISEFVVGMLTKKLRWEREPWVYGIHYLHDRCWKCRGEVKQVFGSSIGVYGDSAKTVPNMSTILSNFDQFIANEELTALGLNTIGKFDTLKGNAPGFPFCNVCIHCGAPQNNHYVMKKLNERGAADGDFDLDALGIGSEDFVSPREATGRWQFEK